MRNGLRTLALTILVVMCEVCLSGCAGTTVYEAAVGRNVSKYLPWSEGADGGFAGPSDTLSNAERRQRMFELDRRIRALNCQFVNLGSFQGRAGFHASQRVRTQAVELDREYDTHAAVLRAVIGR